MENYVHHSRVAKMFFIIDYGLHIDEETCDKILLLIKNFCASSDKKIVRGSYKKPPLKINLHELPDEHIDQIYRIIKLYVIMKYK